VTRPSRTRAAKIERDAIIRDMYARNVPVRQIARTVGLTYGSLRVIACRLGCTKHGQAYIDYRRGFSVPEDKQIAYDELIYELQMTAQEAATALGIAPLHTPETQP
jgi:hypothetical protein